MEKYKATLPGLLKNLPRSVTVYEACTHCVNKYPTPRSVVSPRFTSDEMNIRAPRVTRRPILEQRDYAHEASPGETAPFSRWPLQGNVD